MKKHLVILVTALVIIASVIWVGGGSGVPAPNQAASIAVRTAYVDEAVLTRKLNSLGTAEALMDVDVTTEKSGKVTAIHFEANQSVQKGDVLVELESSVEIAAVQEAKVTLQEDRRVLAHYRKLSKSSAISQTLVDEQEAKVAAGEARLEAAEATLSEFTIKAPFSGVLGFRLISPGTLIEPGTTITTLDAIDTLKIKFTAPEFWVGKIEAGEKLSAFSVAYPDIVFEAVVSAVGNRVDPVTRAVSLQAKLDNKERLLKPGMLLEVSLEGQSREALLIPEEALLQEGTLKFVYLVVGNQVEQRAVKTGVRQDGSIEVIEGLELGDQFVREGVQKIRSGSKINIVAARPAQ